MKKSKIQRVRFKNEIICFQTVIHSKIEYLYLSDVQRRFPTVTAFSLKGVQLSFAANTSSQNSTDLRIKAYPTEIIDAIVPKTTSEIVSRDQLNRIEGKIDRIDENTQQLLIQMRNVMTLMYELHEYTTPRYFFLLPTKNHDWAMVNAVQNLYQSHSKLYFLCECSDDPRELHVAPHEGYSIKKLREFLVKYGPYLLKTMKIVKVLLTFGGFVIPNLSHTTTIIADNLLPSLQSSTNYENIKKQVITMQNLLENPQTKLLYEGTSLVENKDKLQLAPLQGADLRELESYLEHIDCTRALGNLYRTMTDDGHVRWVCQQHYDEISFNKKMTDYVKQFEAMGGKFDLKKKEAILHQLKLTNTKVQMIMEALTKGFNISELILDQCSIYESYFDSLIDIIINRSSIRCLRFIHLDILNYFGSSKYICNHITINLSNSLLNVRFNESYQGGQKNLLIRILTQNKLHRTLDICARHFRNYEQQLQECLDTNKLFTELIVNHANSTKILNPIFHLIINQLKRLKLNYSLVLSSVANHFCQLFETNQTLVELDLLNATAFSDNHFLRKLFHILKKHQSIEKLSLHICKIKAADEKGTLLMNILENYDFISHLRLSQSFISHQLGQVLIHAIKKEHHSLIHLEMSHCDIRKNDILQLKSLKNDGHLMYLDISSETQNSSKSINRSFRANTSINSRWKQSSMIPIGNNWPGDQLNQLDWPCSFTIHEDQTIYVADSNNNRIVAWKYGETCGRLVDIENGQRNDNDQLCCPTDIIIDKKTDSLIIYDDGNKRIVRCPRQHDQQRETIISDIDCANLNMDNHGYLYVSNANKHEVRRWKIGENQGTLVAGGNGQGNRFDQLDEPKHIFVDDDQSIYIADYRNNRVMKWVKYAWEGAVVAGGNGPGDDLNQLRWPHRIVVDQSDILYVLDFGNNRIVRWFKGAKQGQIIFDMFSLPNLLPIDLSFDQENNLYILDCSYHRITKFDLQK